MEANFIKWFVILSIFIILIETAEDMYETHLDQKECTQIVDKNG